MAGVEDGEAEEVLAEFDFLVSETGEGAGEAQSHGDERDWGTYLYIVIMEAFIVLIMPTSVKVKLVPVQYMLMA